MEKRGTKKGVIESQKKRNDNGLTGVILWVIDIMVKFRIDMTFITHTVCV